MAEFVELSCTWRPGTVFPLLAGPALDRLRAVGGGVLPAVEGTRRPGVVVSTGGDVSEAAGRLLATATDRPHEHVVPERVLDVVGGLDGPVAVVGLGRDVQGIGDHPVARNPRAGVLTGRDAASLACLVYRSITPAVGATDRSFVVTNPFHLHDLSADAVEFDELDELRRVRHRVVVFHLHGRECSVSLPDGVVCGRDDDGGPVADLPPPGSPLRVPSCLRGAGCFRADLDESRRVRAADLNAVAVFAASCSAVTGGAGVYPSEVGFGAGLLEGTAVAVVGGLGPHVSEPGAEKEFVSRVAAGQPLGEVVAAMNRGPGQHRGGLTSYALLGDPALSLAPRDPDRAAAPEDAGAAERREQLRHLSQVVLPRCERLAWVELDGQDEAIASVRRSVRDLVSAGPDLPPDGVASVRRAVVDLQLRLVTRGTDRTQREGPDFLGDGTFAFTDVGHEPVRCPGCGLDLAARISLRHAIEDELTVTTVQCRRCGDVHWSTEDHDPVPTLALTGPVDLDVDRSCVPVLERTLHNNGDRDVSGAIGFAFLRFGDPPVLPPPQHLTFELAAGESRTFRFELVGMRDEVRPDLHTCCVLAVVDGVELMAPAVLRIA